MFAAVVALTLTLFTSAALVMFSPLGPLCLLAAALGTTYMLYLTVQMDMRYHSDEVELSD
jgi:hypothetical protein